MFEFNPDPNHRDCYGRTPLHHACRRGNLTAVRFLLSKANLKTSVDSTDDVEMGDGEPYLRLNEKSIGGLTPLMNVCLAEDASRGLEIAQLLHSDSISLVQLVLELFTEGSGKLFLKF